MYYIELPMYQIVTCERYQSYNPGTSMNVKRGRVPLFITYNASINKCQLS
jgi:hypothetical protein